ncbi:MAG: hypothetical protein ABIS20_24480 [Thermoanaerobaculia bacterium]
MRSLRTAAVLILLALSLGTSAFAAKARPAVPSRPSKAAAPSAAGVFAPLWRLAVDGLTKEGCTIEPWGRCGASAPTQDADAGCGIDPWGRCSAGH